MRKLIPVMFLVILFACLFLVFATISSQAEQVYGPPVARLTFTQRVKYSAYLLWYKPLLMIPLDASGREGPFVVAPGESVHSIASNLEVMGFIRNAESFRVYLVYSGLDTTIQSGSYQLSPAMPAITIARKLQDATLEDVTFVILPGWRMEEIAASLPTSGLPITSEEFLSLTRSSADKYDFLSGAVSLEGFLFPDTYIISRTTSDERILDEFIRNFVVNLSPDLKNGFDEQGLSVYQAVTLASIVQREAVHDEERALIASVYINRLRIGMKLEADPTVQYAIGFNESQNTWWTNPLTVSDLEFNSPFNTYLYAGLPPTPIANPGLASLQAVAYPTSSVYYYFRARCDGSGYHAFAETFEAHVANGCH